MILEIYLWGALIWFFLELLAAKGNIFKAFWGGVSWPFQVLIIYSSYSLANSSKNV